MLRCMRTTLNIADELLIEAKQLAARTGRTLTSVVEDALRAAFSRASTPRKEAERFELPTSGEGGVLPGVDLDNSAALLDIMEGTD